MLSPERQRARMSKNYKSLLNLVWHTMLYSCTHMATVGVKGLTVGEIVAVIDLATSAI